MRTYGLLCSRVSDFNETNEPARLDAAAPKNEDHRAHAPAAIMWRCISPQQLGQPCSQALPVFGQALCGQNTICQTNGWGEAARQMGGGIAACGREAEQSQDPVWEVHLHGTRHSLAKLTHDGHVSPDNGTRHASPDKV